MKKNFGIVLAIALGLSALLLTVAFQAGWVRANPSRQERGSVGALISYQGQIQDSSGPYTGTGHFKFAIINETGSTTYWSNDGTSVAGSEPANAVPLAVNSGLFSVNLGDTSGTYSNMTQIIGPNTFSEYPTLLRIWFSPDGSAFTKMPDQKVTVVPYALQAVESVFAWNADTATSAGYASEAGQADTADLFDGLSSSWFQKRVDGTCVVGKAVTAVNSDGSVVCSSTFQYRVSGSCVVGEAVRSINADGSVVCEPMPEVPVFTLSNLVMESGDHAAVIGSDGLGFIAFYDPDGMDLRSLHCNDINCTGGLSYVLDSTGDVGQDVDVAIGVDGFPLISYYDATNGDLKVVHCNDVACSTRSRTSYESGNNVGRATSIVVGATGRGLISFVDMTNNDVLVAQCSNITCSTINGPWTIADKSYVITDTEIAFGQYHRPLVVYNVSEESFPYLYSFHCLSNDCSDGGSEAFLGTAPLGSMVTVDDDDGLVLISVTIGSFLGVLYCDTSTCATALLRYIGSSELGLGSSIAIGADGLPIISYIDSSNNLKIAHCSDFMCNTSFIYTLDNSGTAATSTSVVVGMDSMGLVLYYDGTNDHLRSAHCSNRFCNPDW